LDNLFTEHYIINSKYQGVWDELLMHREQVARLCPQRWLKNSQKLVEVDKKRFLTSLQEGGTFGYNPKYLCYLMLDNERYTRYVSGESYSELLKPKDVNEILQIKRGKYAKDEAEKLFDTLYAHY
jgi:hypothetical protein